MLSDKSKSLEEHVPSISTDLLQLPPRQRIPTHMLHACAIGVRIVMRQ